MPIDLACKNRRCSLRYTCYRYLATPMFYQVYLKKTPKGLDKRKKICYNEVSTDEFLRLEQNGNQ